MGKIIEKNVNNVIDGGRAPNHDINRVKVVDVTFNIIREDLNNPPYRIYYLSNLVAV